MEGIFYKGAESFPLADCNKNDPSLLLFPFLSLLPSLLLLLFFSLFLLLLFLLSLLLFLFLFLSLLLSLLLLASNHLCAKLFWETAPY